MNISDYIEQADEVCGLPDTCVRIQELLQDETSSIDDFADVLACDPLLTSHVLKLANSALYNFSFSIDTLAKAITALGMKAIYSLVLISAATEALKKLNTQAIDLDRHWRVSINTALILKRLAGDKKSFDSERLFTLGLLHNIGELIVCQVTPVKAQKCEAYSAELLPKNKQLIELGFTYAELGAALFENWKFPEKMIDTIQMQHTPDDNEEAQLLHLASNLALISVHPEMYSIDSLLDDYLIQKFSLTEAKLEDAIDWANLGAFSLFALVNPADASIY
ncbi:HDOD domain-containing protein [Catenovulum sp. 2E275]|uniref:HDOD domain-containing protein n=1 Tax=Catenovulum sp. 2E275 TaxID=2980497 RepID=UPI0021CEC1F7|nr:HDOD domain-containing protein [Catenovulum sp. 2E275]MCU4677142.1 HDOD domain-containing protein [Catenovulum sp. 2E275]